MTNFQTPRALTRNRCPFAFFAVLALLSEARVPTASAQNPSSVARKNVQSGKTGLGVGYGSYRSYFESNQSGLRGRNSFLAFTSRRAFDRIFGAADMMGEQKFLLDNAFESGIVVAVIKRDTAIWNYRVQRVVANGRSASVYYSAQSLPANAQTSKSQITNAQTASFASPLIVALDGRNYTSILFVENGKNVRRIAVGAQTSNATRTSNAQLATQSSTLQPLNAIPQKMKRASVEGALSGPISNGASNRFFEGTYRVGATSCVVNPIKMAFEVKWANRHKPQIFFADSSKSERRPVYSAEESGGSARFVFDDARFERGRFIRADGQAFPLFKTSKPRDATRQIFVYLVAVGDNGKIGKKFGCGDSLVAVRRPVSVLESPLKAALQELISLPSQYPGNSKLRNFWKGRNLQIQRVSVRGGVARIQIAGEVFVAGVCDQPRITTQIEATARQFASVKRVKVFIGGKSLQSAIE